MKRSKWESIKLGVKKGLLTPIYPDKVVAINSSLFVRVFRVLGGLSIISLLLSEKLELSILEYIVTALIATLFFIYNVILTLISIRYMWKSIKEGKLDIRNSPFDRFGSAIGKAIWCIKGACVGAGAMGTGIGIGLAIDGGLRSVGRETIMEKNMGLLMNKILPVTKYQYNSYLERIYNLEVEIKDYECKLNEATIEKKEEYINLWKDKIKENNLKRDYYRSELKEIKNRLTKK